MENINDISPDDHVLFNEKPGVLTSSIANITLGKIKTISQLVRSSLLESFEMFEINVLLYIRRAAYVQETETSLLYAAHRGSARKWDTYGVCIVHTTGNKPNLMRPHGEKKKEALIKPRKSRSMYIPDNVKEPRRSAINSAVPTLSTSTLRWPLTRRTFNHSRIRKMG